jgi:hypothetical protein
MSHAVFYVPWVGSDEGAPDYDVAGSLHLTEADAHAYFADMRAAERAQAAQRGHDPKNYVPGYYVRPDGDPRPVSVDENTYAKIAKSKNGVRAVKSTTEKFSVR